MEHDHKMTQVLELTDYNFRATIRNLLSDINKNKHPCNESENTMFHEEK